MQARLAKLETSQLATALQLAASLLRLGCSERQALRLVDEWLAGSDGARVTRISRPATAAEASLAASL